MTPYSMGILGIFLGELLGWLTIGFIQRAVKPLPSGGGYKAHLNWNFDFPAFVC